jgi:D-sedoheptulose 7-phosphate isomerase
MSALIPRLDNLISRRPELASCRDSIQSAYDELVTCFTRGGRLYLCGNGGSASDAEHIAGELLKGFDRRRAPKLPAEANPTLQHLQGGLPAIPLTGFPALRTAVANDMAGELEFAQLVYALGREGDVLLSLTCSGNARNVGLALETARIHKMRTIVLTGRTGGKARALADIAICAPADEVYLIQELHLPIYHTLCLALEDHFFS